MLSHWSLKESTEQVERVLSNEVVELGLVETLSSLMDSSVLEASTCRWLNLWNLGLLCTFAYTPAFVHEG
jgi:hypothetical protein